MKCQASPIEDVEQELQDLGIVAPVTMNEMDIRLMLVECRLRADGRMPGEEKAKRVKKAKYANEFEKTLYENSAYEALYNKCAEAYDTNRMNIMAEYMIDREKALLFYSEIYKDFLAELEVALNTKEVKVLTSPKVGWSGFPTNIGEEGIRATFSALGELVEFDAQESDDGMSMQGSATFADMETAQACVTQYDGMDMGLGTAIEISAA